MFRRRPLRRPLGRPMAGRALAPAPAVPRALVLANQAFESGDYPEAAQRFAAIAAAAEGRGGPRAPQFYFQAGRACLLAGEIDPGMGHLKRGLMLLSRRGDHARMQTAGSRIVSELEGRGLQDQARQVSEWLQAELPKGFEAVAPSAPRQAVFPTHCPSCGAGLRPTETDWLDDLTIECAFCGSPVRGER